MITVTHTHRMMDLWYGKELIMNRILIYGLLMIGGMLGCVSCSNAAAHGPAQTDSTQWGEEVSVNTVAAMKGKEGIVVLDVREDDEYADAHIPGVVHIPMGQVMEKKDEFINAKAVFVTCRSGNRSGRVVDALRARGHTHVHNMAGGIRAWKSADLPVESGK
jgi:rhodanese-related sulfurtransferase